MSHYTISVPVKDVASLDTILTALQNIGIKTARVGLNKTVVAPVAAPVETVLPLDLFPVFKTTAGRGHSPDKEQRTVNYVGGIRNKGISAHDLLFEILNSEPRVFTQQEIEDVFESRQFARKSAGPALSVARKAGTITCVAYHRWCVAGLVIHK